MRFRISPRYGHSLLSSNVTAITARLVFEGLFCGRCEKYLKTGMMGCVNKSGNIKSSLQCLRIGQASTLLVNGPRRPAMF